VTALKVSRFTKVDSFLGAYLGIVFIFSPLTESIALATLELKRNLKRNPLFDNWGVEYFKFKNKACTYTGIANITEYRF